MTLTVGDRVMTPDGMGTVTLMSENGTLAEVRLDPTTPARFFEFSVYRISALQLRTQEEQES